MPAEPQNNTNCHSLLVACGLFAVAVTVSTAGLWYTGQVRLVERVKTTTGASIVRTTIYGYRADVYYPNHSHIGYGQGRLFTPSLQQQGTQYHRWLDVPAVNRLIPNYSVTGS